jgi:uncharacterized protein (DUF983 family)
MKQPNIDEETRGAFFICTKCGNPNGWTAPVSNIQACKFCGRNHPNVDKLLRNTINGRTD